MQFLNREVKNMRKANGILATKDADDYAYIGTFIGFLERIINIILTAFERLSSLGKKDDAATKTDA